MSTNVSLQAVPAPPPAKRFPDGGIPALILLALWSPLMGVISLSALPSRQALWGNATGPVHPAQDAIALFAAGASAFAALQMLWLLHRRAGPRAYVMVAGALCMAIVVACFVLVGAIFLDAMAGFNDMTG